MKVYAAEHQSVCPDTLSFKLLSMIYGTVILVDGGYKSADKAAENLKRILLLEL